MKSGKDKWNKIRSSRNGSDAASVGLGRRDFLKGLLSAALISTLNPSYLYAGGIKEHGSGPVVLRVSTPSVIKDEGFEPGRYLDHIDGDVVAEMLSKGLMELTGKKDVKSAWISLLVGYRSGDRIAIKPNFNFVNHGQKYTITAPQLIDAVVTQLVEEVGVEPSNIYIYDLCKLILHDTVRSRIKYPVSYIERFDTSTITGKIRLRLGYGDAAADYTAPIRMRRRVVDADKNEVVCYIPKVLTKAEHLINMPLLTNHLFISNSGALKNHFGTVRFSNLQSYPVVLHGEGISSAIADINRNSHIALKTRLIIADALYGVYDRGEGHGKRPWKTLGGFPSSILLSKDPVAIDSVMASMVIRERRAQGLETGPYSYLEEAERLGLGTFELCCGNESFRKIDYRDIKV